MAPKSKLLSLFTRDHAQLAEQHLREGRKDKAAEANRIAHGTPKAARELAKARKDKAEQGLSGHRLEKSEDDN